MGNSAPLIIYDMDGLLINSEPFWRQAEIKVFGSVGLHLTEEDCIATTGFRFDEVVDYWWQKRPWSGKSKMQVHDEVLDEMEYAITHRAEAMKGVKESLEYFANNGCRIALASSSAMRLIIATVQKLNIEHYFEMLFSAEHERYGKPHPAVFLRTAETLGVDPSRCLVLEDSLNGVLAAKAAKMKCVVVPLPEDYENPRWIIADDKWRTLHDVQARAPRLLA